MKKRNKERSISRIKKTTLHLFQKKGYAGTTMSAIAEKADVNIALIYKYFPRGKLDIILSIGSDILKEAKGGFALDISDSPSDLLRNLIRTMLETHRKNQTILKALEVEYLSNKNIYDEEEFAILTGGVDTMLGFSNLIKRLSRRNSNDIERVGRLVFHLIDGLIHRHVLIVKIDEDDEMVVDFIADLVLTFIGIKT
jgi:AcrR family transcriptional regulator